MAHGIFVSYRRKDTESVASRLADDLRAQLAGVQIFRDVETIAPGEDFVISLERALADCAVMLVLIGPIWSDIRDDQGHRRLEDPNDWTRLEVATALARNVRVIPVLSGGAQLPASQALPEDIQALTRRQAIQIDNNRWRYDVDQLIDALVRAEGFKRIKAAKPPSMWRKAALIGGCVFLGMVLFAMMADKKGPANDPDPVEPDEVLNEPVVPPVEKAAPKAVAPKPRVTRPTPAEEPPVVSQRSGPFPDAPIVPRTPNLAGWWRTTSAIQYFFQQNGADIGIQVGMNGQQTGGGRGRVQGNVLQMNVTVMFNGIAQTANCTMVGAPNGASFSGSCVSPRGAFPLNIFR